VHFGDTWEWDGASWTEVVTAHTPGVRSLHAMAHDTARGRTVVFGGFNETWNQASGTWEYDGTDWTQASPATEPPTRLGAAMAYDAGAGGVVLLRGWGGEAGLEDYLMDQWVWDGSTWVSQPLGGLGPREGPALVATDWGLMTFGGFPDQIAVETCQSLSDDWYCESVPTTPGVDLLFGSGSLVHDPQRDVSILLTSEGQYTHRHWEWDGYAWHFRALLNVPPAANRGMANDPVRGVTVLFGGGYSMFGQPSDETHEFDGVEWVRRYPTTSPSARTTAMTYDAGRGVMLIFGGSGGGFLLDDTWEWDGTTWTERSPGTRPTARLTSLAYDPVRDVVVMFGGQGDNGTNLNDTWEWDGTTWTEHSPVIRPPARLGPLTYDPARGRVVLVGGSLWSGMGVTNLADVWEWDGSAWTQVATPTQPSSSGTLASYDLARREILRVGEETWAYRLDSDRPTEGCQGRDADGDGRVDCDDPDCQGRCAPLCVPGLAACDPAWPRCGDGVCSAVESCRLCAEDCGACPARCGDGFCEGGETDASCPGDCFAICGNGRCDAGEDCASCAGDCC
jgi:hypothetical protein